MCWSPVNSFIAYNNIFPCLVDSYLVKLETRYFPIWSKWVVSALVKNDYLSAVCVVTQNEPLLDVAHHILEVSQLFDKFGAILVTDHRHEIEKPEIYIWNDFKLGKVHWLKHYVQDNFYVIELTYFFNEIPT